MLNSIANAFAFWNPVIDYTAINKKTSGRFLIDQTALTIRRIALLALGVLIAVWALKYSLSVFTGCCIVLLLNYNGKYEQFEKWRAAKRLDKLAVDLFKLSVDIPLDAYLYASSAPFVVKSLLKSKEIIVKTINNFKIITAMGALHNLGIALNVPKVLDIDCSGTLINIDFDKALIVHKVRIDKQESLNVLKVLIDAGTFNEGMPNYVHRELLLSRSELAFYAIKTETLRPKDLSKNELVTILSNINEEKLLQLLIQKGFDIDSINDFGQTAMIIAIGEMDVIKIKLLIDAGATLPRGDETINIFVPIREYYITVKLTVNEFVADKEDVSDVLFGRKL